MKRKILSFLMVFALLLSIAPSCLAAPTLEERLKAKGVPATVDIDVLSEISLRFSTKNSFSNTLISTEKQSFELFPKVDYKTTVYMAGVREQFTNYVNLAKLYCAGDVDLLEDLAEMPVYGQFNIDVICPDDVTIPTSFLNGNSLYGFNDQVNHVFKEVSRTYVSNGDGTSTLSITIVTKNPADASLDYVTEAQLENNLETYLPDFTLTCLGLQPNAYGTRTIEGSVSGWTKIGNNPADPITTFNYTMVDIAEPSNDYVTGSFKISQMPAGVIVGPSGSEPTPPDGGLTDKIIVNVITGDGSYVADTYPVQGKHYLDVDNLSIPSKSGFAFDGWYFDRNFATPVDASLATDPNGNIALKVSQNTNIYAKFINLTAPDALNAAEHAAYVIGYPEGDVRPENNITREEIATIFYRLLKDEIRSSLLSTESVFSDVEAERWSNKAVSTMAKGGYINGYPDGTFGPSKSITRAEFVTVVARFLDAQTVDSSVNFTDINGHWAENSIIGVASNYWINGYEDNTFRPDHFITRAEAMTIINRMLVRYLAADGIHADTKQWIDNPSDKWYYLDVLEATNSHTQDRKENKYHELWKTIEPNKVWH